MNRSNEANSYDAFINDLEIDNASKANKRTTGGTILRFSAVEASTQQQAVNTTNDNPTGTNPMTTIATGAIVTNTTTEVTTTVTSKKKVVIHLILSCIAMILGFVGFIFALRAARVKADGTTNKTSISTEPSSKYDDDDDILVYNARMEFKGNFTRNLKSKPVMTTLQKSIMMASSLALSAYGIYGVVTSIKKLRGSV